VHRVRAQDQQLGSCSFKRSSLVGFMLVGTLLIPVLLVLAVLASSPFTHRLAREYWHGFGTLAKERRRWEAACFHAGLYHPETNLKQERPAPRVRSFEDAPTGRKLVVQCRHGWTATDIQRAAEALASWYRAREVRVSVDPADCSRVTVLIVKTGPARADERRALAQALHQPLLTLGPHPRNRGGGVYLPCIVSFTGGIGRI
jgi:hypothetical protein